MTTDARLQRIFYEMALCAVGYSTTKRVDWGYLSSGVIWVIIYDFPLPPGYNYRTTDVMILLPPNYPQTPPDWFYVDHNLRLANGERPPHVFYDDTSYDPNRGIYGEAPPPMVGWTACCLHIREWRPKANPAEGHSLLSVCELIGKAFKRWKRKR